MSVLYAEDQAVVQQIRDVGPWSLEKLAILKEYLAAFVHATQRARGRTYVDLFAGPGQNQSRETGEVLDGSPLIAMKLTPAFSRFIFVESDPDSWSSLGVWVSQLGHSKDAVMVSGDCNQKIDEVLSLIPRGVPCFVFLDPPSPTLDWNTVAKIAGIRVGYYKRRPEQLILFPYFMGLVRLMPRNEEPETFWGPVVEEQISRVMPDSSKWKAVYEGWRRHDFQAQQKHRRLAYLYWAGLKELGYKHVLGPRLFRTPNGHKLYDLFFASDHVAGRNIMRGVFNKQRTMFDQQLPLIMEDPYDFKEGEDWYLELKTGETDARQNQN